jgi:signal transduction histidine kinase
MKLIENFCSDQKGFDEDLHKKICEFFGTDKDSTKFGVLMANRNYLECTGSKVVWDNENAIVLTFREITDLVKLENQITQTSKTLKILRGISHELKTPMNMVINQNLEIFNDIKGVSDMTVKMVKRNVSILQYILSLIRDMIDYSHLKSNNLALSFSWVGITDLIEDTIVILQDMYINSSFELHLSNQNMNVYTDKNRLRQSLLSLISTSLG